MDYGGDGFDVLRVSIGLPVAVLAACPVDGACADYFVRTNETRSRGVNDPRPRGPGTGFGGWQRGSFTPRLPLHCRRGLTAHATRGTKRRAISVSPTRFAFNNMRDTRSDRHVLVVERYGDLLRAPGGGTLLPSLCSPLRSGDPRTTRSQPGV